MTNPPLTLDGIRMIADPAERGRAVGPYIEAANEKIADARVVRAEAVLELLTSGVGVTETARLVGLSTSAVAQIRAIEYAKRANR